MTPIRTIHVGVRGRGRWALDALTADDRFQPVAIVSRDPAAVTAEAAAAGLEPSSVFTTLPDALAAHDCDAVVSCTPVGLHARDVGDALAAGKHVLVEKPLSNDWAEAVGLVDAAEAAGVELVVAQNYRFSAPFQTLQHALASGRYGTPMLVDLALHKYRPAPRQQDYPFAAFWDQGCHHVDALQWILGPISSAQVTTFSAPWSRYRDDAGLAAVLRFESGAVWTYLVSNLARVFDHRFLVQSEHGALRFDGQRWWWQRAAAPDDAPWGWNDDRVALDEPPGLPPSGEHGVVDAFHHAVTRHERCGISGRENLEVLRVCEMARRAGTEQRVVSRDEIR